MQVPCIWWVFLCLLLTNCQENQPVTKPAIVVQKLSDFKGNEDFLTFSPTGSYLAFTAKPQDNTDVYILPIKGAVPKKISHQKGDNIRPKWSPDGKYLLYLSNQEEDTNLMVYAIATEKEYQITDSLHKPMRAEWSPDGNTIVFENITNNNRALWKIPTTGGIPQQLTSLKGNAYNFGWSPNGQWLGFMTRGTPNENLMLLNTATNEIEQLTDNIGHEWHPKWSKDSKTVLFYSTWNKEMTDVWTIDVATKKLTSLTNNPWEEFGPVWTNQPNQIAFYTENQGQRDIALLDITSKKLKYLNLFEHFTVAWPALEWHPSKPVLACLSNAEKDHLYKVNLSTKVSSRITQQNTQERSPIYSPNGQHILFDDTGFNENRDIYQLALKTGQIQKLRVNKQAHHFSYLPAYSPDGNHIAYILGTSGSLDGDNIWIMETDGTNQQQITYTGGVRNFIWTLDNEHLIFAHDSSANFEYDILKVTIQDRSIHTLVKSKGSQQPSSVAPDGQHFLYFSDETGNNQLYQMPINGGKAILVPNQLNNSEWGVYHPDGQSIAFLSNDNLERNYDLYVGDITGTKIERITNDAAQESRPAWASSGQHLIYSANKGDKDIFLVKILNNN